LENAIFLAVPVADLQERHLLMRNFVIAGTAGQCTKVNYFGLLHWTLGWF
jgi:hypothetical protein